MANRRTTLKDVASAAGVSTGTVSMVLNGSPLVADSTRAHVQKAIHELGYVYDRAAANLRNRRSNIVGVSSSDLVNPYYADVTAGIQAALEQLGRALVLGNCAESIERQWRFLQTLREYNAEGLIIMPAMNTPQSHLQQMQQWRIPVVQVSRYLPDAKTDYVGNDNRMATEMVTKHLFSLGHERLAYIGLNPSISTGQDRFTGFRDTILAHTAAEPEYVIACSPSRKNGFDAALALFRAANPPTGIVCFNDDLAFGAMLGLRQLGLEPGQDCSVVGIDDVAEAAFWYPALTTVTTNREEMGQEAARLLISRIAEPDRPVEHVVLTPVLTIRQSSRVPPRPKASRRRRRAAPTPDQPH